MGGIREVEDITHRPAVYVEKRLLVFLRSKSAEHFGQDTPVKIILYGSRTRGDHGSRSDYDLAIQIDPEVEEKWSSFAVDVREEAPTLKKIDLVNLLECPTELRARILKEGKIVYEQKT